MAAACTGTCPAPSCWRVRVRHVLSYEDLRSDEAPALQCRESASSEPLSASQAVLGASGAWSAWEVAWEGPTTCSGGSRWNHISKCWTELVCKRRLAAAAGGPGRLRRQPAVWLAARCRRCGRVRFPQTLYNPMNAQSPQEAALRPEALRCPGVALVRHSRAAARRLARTPLACMLRPMPPPAETPVDMLPSP